jgi:glycosyltransferase involved in cell wall biosynthesis
MILFQLIQKPQFRGAELFACQLSKHLEASGHKVYLISLYPGQNELPFSGDQIHLNRTISERWTDYKGWKALAELIQKHQPDVVQCNAGDTLKFAVFSKQLFGWQQPIVARNASMVSLYINNPLVKYINKWLYTKADSIISVSQNSKKDINTLFPETLSKTKVIPVGIEIVQPKAVSWLGGKEAKKHIVHVGGFSFEKNHAGLLSIFKKFIVDHPDTHLHLLGEGPKKEAIQQLVIALDLSAKVTFYGWILTPTDYIAKADVLVLPSIIEGLPGVLLEAMSVKTPVIAYNVGGISEVVDNLVTGFLVPKNDESIFVEALTKVFSMPNKNMTDHAFEMVNQQYNNVAIAKQFEEEYVKLNTKH